MASFPISAITARLIRPQRFFLKLFSIGIVLTAEVLLAGSPSPSQAHQASSPAAPSTKRPCDTPAFRQFDFWLGSWIVRGAGGKEVGRNEISQTSGGCAIMERWTSNTGTTGTSLNYYDPTDRKWHQHWVGSDGSVLHLAGGLENGAMVLTSAGLSQRITWSVTPEGKVKQEWTVSNDRGKTWSPNFVGFYERGPL